MVEHFVKKQNKANTMDKEEDVKSNTEMTEDENEVFVRYIRGIVDGLKHKYAVSERIINYSGFSENSDIFVY
jgi:head-tail adaptor